jgi:hypothetical protein
MGTRSAIGYKTPQGKIRAKYSHYDGYPAGVGKTLLEHYQEARKIAQMVELGDQSFLAPEIFPKGEHSFMKPEEGVTVFYGRDRGETGVEAKEFDTVQEFVEYYEGAGCEYFYLIQTGGEWIYHDRYGVGNDANGFPIFDFLEPKVEAEVARLRAQGYNV